jgi:hypothetical protein
MTLKILRGVKKNNKRNHIADAPYHSKLLARQTQAAVSATRHHANPYSGAPPPIPMP